MIIRVILIQEFKIFYRYLRSTVKKIDNIFYFITKSLVGFVNSNSQDHQIFMVYHIFRYNIKKLLLLLLATCSFSGYSQVEYSGEVNAQGLFSTGERLPFWMYHNKRGRISENTIVATWVSGKAIQEFRDYSKLEVGLGVLYQDGLRNEIFLDEAYLQYKTLQAYFIVGRKQEKELYNGLSASNRSMLWSLNARPLPGFSFGTNAPVYFNPFFERGLGLEVAWDEFILEKDRFISRARVHHKYVGLVYRTENNLLIKAGARHIAQWAGTGPDGEERPGSFEDYYRIVMGMGSSISNYTASYELNIIKTTRKYKFELLYNYISESFSSLTLGSFPDGRYGIFAASKDKDQLINAVMYEFYTTRNQNHRQSSRPLGDNYLNDGIYRSGWTYENRVIGTPFFTPHPMGEGIINNRYISHHIGIGGQFSDYFTSFPYKLLFSYSANSGTHSQKYPTTQDLFALFSEFAVLRDFVNVDLQFGTEFNNLSKPLFGFGVQVKKLF